VAVGNVRFPGLNAPTLPGTGTGRPGAAGQSFAQALQKAIGQVNTAQVQRDRMIDGVVTGEVTQVHDVMVAAEEAKLAFDLMLEVRNKLLESYNQIMQMQV